MTKKFEGLLMGMGNPLLDICANVDQAFLDKYELQLDCAILAEDKHQPLYQDLVDHYPVQYIAGGATQNSMRVAQWMLNQKDMVAFMGCVGDDGYGKHLEECATKDGVTVHYMKDPTTPSGTCAALILGGERSLVANLAAANNFQPSHLETPKAQEIIEAAQYYYCAGFFLTVSVESLLKVAEHAVSHNNNKVFCINLSAPFIVDFFSEPLAEALQYADYVFGNESEAAAYGKKNLVPGNNGSDDLVQVAQAIAALPSKTKKNDDPRPRTVIFTQGSKSTIVYSNGKVTEYAVEPVPIDQIVDTNGAGDAFVGGFLSQLVLGKEVGQCVQAGHYAARVCIQQSGTSLDRPCDYKN